MTDVFHTETYTHKNGKQYLVELSYDEHMGPPDQEHDGHGEVIDDLTFDPTDAEAVQDYVSEHVYEEHELEQIARYGMMEPLGDGSYRYAGHVKYYDVWETMKKAKAEGWGPGEEWDKANPNATPDERARAAAMLDYDYLRGWYSDDWHWCVVSVYALDEDGEKDEGTAHHCGGYESTIIDDRKWFDECIEDGISQVEHDIKRIMHKNQLELELV